MIINDAFVIKDGGNYFRGSITSTASGSPLAIFAPLSSLTRTYKSKRAAETARRWILEHYESPFVAVDYIASADVPDEAEPTEPPSAPPAPPQKLQEEQLEEVPFAECAGWEGLDRLCGKYPAILKKHLRYAIIQPDSKMFYLPSDERQAWQRYFRECEKFVLSRIDAREKKDLGA